MFDWEHAHHAIGPDLFTPISSAARQWAIDAAPAGLQPVDGVYTVPSWDVAAFRARLEAEGFTIRTED